MNNSNVILKVEHLKKSYGKFKVLEDVNFQIERGHILGLLGRNGAGKTTMLKTILGLNVNYGGKIFFMGEPLNSDNEITKNKIGSLVDVTFFEDLTAYENIKMTMMITRNFNHKNINSRIDELLQFVQLTGAKQKKVKSFSFGMKQRLALAQSLIYEPELLILDEPFVGLDPIGIDDTKKILKRLCSEKNTSIIFSSHQLTEVEDISDDIIVLNKGRINYSGTYDSIKNSGKDLIDLMR